MNNPTVTLTEFLPSWYVLQCTICDYEAIWIPYPAHILLLRGVIEHGT
jgi:hypothetical protein